MLRGQSLDRETAAGFPGRLVLTVLAVALVTAAAGAVWWRRTQSQTTAPVYQTSTAVVGTVTTTVTATGPVSASISIPLTFKSAGKITKIDVQVGDVVTAGQKLAEQDPTDLQTALTQATSALGQQQANLAKLRQGATPQAIAVAQASVESAQQALQNAQKNQGVVAAQGQSDLSAAQVAVQNERQAVQDAQKNQGAVQAQITASQRADQTTVQTAQQAVQNAQKNLASVQAQIQASTASDRTAVRNAQTTLQNAQTALGQAQQARQAAQAVQPLTIAKAKNDLYTAQVSRDAACNPSNNQKSDVQCQAGNGSVNSAQTALDAANAGVAQGAVQQAQAVQAAQASLDGATSALQTARDALGANVAKEQGTLLAAQTSVDGATSAVKAAQAAQTSDQAKNQASVVAGQQQVDGALASLQAGQAALDGISAKNAGSAQAAQTSVDQATSAVKAAQANLAQVQAPPTPAEVAAQQAQVDQAQVQVDQAQQSLGAAVLNAPIGGTISAINGQAGQDISGGVVASSNANTTAFMVVTDLNRLQVTSQVNESDMAHVKVGDPANFTIDAYPNQEFRGQVAYIQPQGTTTQNVVNYSVTSTIETTTVKPLPGMTANVTIVTAQKPQVLTVPAAALSFGLSQARSQTGTSGTRAATTAAGGQAGPQGQAGGAQGGQGQGAQGGQRSATSGQATSSGQQSNSGTVVVLQQGKQVATPVTIGLNDGKNVEVKSGMDAGAVVVTGVGSSTTAKSATSGLNQTRGIGIGGF